MEPIEHPDTTPRQKSSSLAWVTPKRIVVVLVLTTIGALIVKPYFGYDVSFSVLWFRLLVVALVMLVGFVATDVVWHRATRPRIPLLTAQLVGVTVGAFVGTIVSGLVIGRSLTQMFSVEPMLLGIVVFTTVAIGIGTITAMVLVYRERAARAEVDAVRASSRQQALEKQVLEAQLKLMQAQIEPHFLFNTLANVQHLVTVDQALANRVLSSLIRYLRAALPQMRQGETTLQREVDLARAFLEIHAVRMASRLAFSFDVPEALGSTTIPPMMLMTLVENAIKHGLDPLQEGGRIDIRARLDGAHLVIEVADTGAGITNASSSGTGVGLANIRERLCALFGREAALTLSENAPRGVVATLRMPRE